MSRRGYYYVVMHREIGVVGPIPIPSFDEPKTKLEGTFMYGPFEEKTNADKKACELRNLARTGKKRTHNGRKEEDSEDLG